MASNSSDFKAVMLTTSH